MRELFYSLLGALVSLLCAYFVLRRREVKRGRPLLRELSEFLGKDLNEFPIVTRRFASVDLANLHVAVEKEAEARSPGGVSDLKFLGYKLAFGEHQNSLRELLVKEKQFAMARVGPVQYRQVDVGVDQRIQCVQNGLHLIQYPGRKLIAHVRADKFAGALELEVMSASKDLSAGFIEGVLEQIRKENVYRGKVISLEEASDNRGRGFGQLEVRFHRLPPILPEEIILPAETRALIERNTVRFFENAEALRRSGRSLRRGILLHGKPGTGKTYTAKWLAQSLNGVTVILLSGEQLEHVKECCQLARMLAPAMVILEDIDLIASARDEARHPYFQVTLHQLLNEMDDLSSDAEVIFLLTTNRPEAIEPALAARPGRVDQAIEFPLPDAECRRRLLELYGRGITLALADTDGLIQKTEGASPAFIQELVRKAALIAAEENSLEDGILRVTDPHCDQAIRELTLGGGELTRNLLGFKHSPVPLEPRRAGKQPSKRRSKTPQAQAEP